METLTLDASKDRIITGFGQTSVIFIPFKVARPAIGADSGGRQAAAALMPSVAQVVLIKDLWLAITTCKNPQKQN